MDELMTTCFRQLSQHECQELTRICARIFACEEAPRPPAPARHAVTSSRDDH